MADREATRRRMLKVAGAMGMTGAAGCLGGGGGGDPTATPDGGGSTATPDGGSGTAASGGDGGSEADWIYDQEQNPGPMIRYQNLGAMDGDPAGSANIEAFQEQYSDLEVKPVITDPSSVLQFARTRLQGQDNKIDVYSLQPYDIWPLAQEGYLEPVGQYIDDEHLDGLIDSVVEASRMPQPFHQDVQVPDGLYGVPGVGTEESWSPFVNQDVMEEAGYERDRQFENYSDFISVMKDIQSQGVVENAVIFPYADAREGGEIFTSHLVAAGSVLFDGRTPKFDTDAAMTGISNFLSMFQEGVAPTGVTSLTEGNTTQQFFQGNAAVMINASSNLFLPGKELPGDKPAEEIARIDNYPKPEGVSDTPSLQITPTNFSLSVFSKNKRNAVKWMNYYASKEAQKRELVEEGNLSLNLEVYEDSDVKENVPYADVMKNQLENSIIVPMPDSGQVKQMMYDAVTSAIANGWPADRLSSTLQSEAESIVG